MNKVDISRLSLENICKWGENDSAPLSFWPPRREEIQRFVEVAKAVHAGEDKPIILDVGCGNGFLSYLLAETGEVNVIGMDPNKEVIQKSQYSHPNLRFEIGNAEDAAKRYKDSVDAVFNSWMPLGLNLTPDIRRVNAKSIIYVKEQQATGVDECYYEELVYDEGFDKYDEDADKHKHPNPISPEDGISYHPGRNYIQAFKWSGRTTYEINPLMRYSHDINALRNYKQLFYGIMAVGDCNFIDIQFRKDVPIPEIQVPDTKPYQWESELEFLGEHLKKMDRCYDEVYRNEPKAEPAPIKGHRSGPGRRR